jgi:hypothetical protein
MKIETVILENQCVTVVGMYRHKIAVITAKQIYSYAKTLKDALCCECTVL